MTADQQKRGGGDSDREQRHDHLREDHEQFADFFENAAVPMHWVGPDGIILRANQAELDALGYSRDEYVGRHIADFHADQEVIDDILERLSSGEVLKDYEARMRCKDGSIRHVLIDSSVNWEDGEFINTRCVTRDVTERKVRERELAEQRERYRGLVDAAPVTIAIYDAAGEIVYVNDEGVELVGAGDLEDMVGEPAIEYVHPDDRQGAVERMQRVIEAREAVPPRETSIVTHDGEVKHTIITSVPITHEGAPAGQLVLTDITEQKERKRELQRVRERMEFALNATDAVVWDWNVDDDRASFYPSAEQLYGTTVENWEDFVEVIHPEDREQVQREIEEALETGEPKHEEIRIVRDGEVRWIEAPGQPVQDDDGPTRMIGVARDITERKTYEYRLKASNERLEQFAYAASHDLQEPLRMVSSYLRLVENRAGDELTEETEEFLEFAVDGADRMREMINGLLAYSRIEAQGEPLESVDLNEVVADVCDDLDVRITECDGEVNVEELPRVTGDERQLRQVFQNLLSNALEYSGDGPPRVRISADRESPMWEVSVRDEGIGIEPDEHDRIFEVFQRLQSQNGNGGSGIGLALCERIVERHGGEIWVDSTPGEGSTFSFTLPASSPNT